MQVSIETTSGLERRLTVGIPAERIDVEVNIRLQKAAQDVKLPGFRPGKVPMKVMRQRFGPGVRQEVLGEVRGVAFSQYGTESENQLTIEPVETSAATTDNDGTYIVELRPYLASDDAKKVDENRLGWNFPGLRGVVVIPGSPEIRVGDAIELHGEPIVGMFEGVGSETIWDASTSSEGEEGGGSESGGLFVQWE